jgi:hypothetical protein
VDAVDDERVTVVAAGVDVRDLILHDRAVAKKKNPTVRHARPTSAAQR